MGGLEAEGESLSLRRAWIEIAWPPGPRRIRRRRSPYGERGLKCELGGEQERLRKSLSLRRAWIEMFVREHCGVWVAVALLTESVD